MRRKEAKYGKNEESKSEKETHKKKAPAPLLTLLLLVVGPSGARIARLPCPHSRPAQAGTHAHSFLSFSTCASCAFPLHQMDGKSRTRPCAPAACPVMASGALLTFCLRVSVVHVMHCHGHGPALATIRTFLKWTGERS